MSDFTADKSRPLIPWWGKLIGTLVLLALLGLGTIYLLGVAATRRCERYYAELEAAGEPLTMEAIDARRAELPDEKNGALVIDRLFDELEKVKAESEWVFVLGSRDPCTDFFTGVPRQAIEPSREFLAEHQELLEELESLADKPTGRFELGLPEGPLNSILPSLTPVRTAAKLERVSGIVKLVDGDLEGAAHTSILGFHIAGTPNEHPTVISALVEMACDALPLRATESILRVGELPEQTLAELADKIDFRLESSTMRWGLWVERAWAAQLFEDLATRKLSAASFSSYSGSGPPPVSLVPKVLIRKNQMRSMEMLGWLIEAVDDPQALLAAARRMDKEVSSLPSTQFLTKILIPSLSRACELHARVIAQLRSTRAGLAAEQYRMKTGKLPDSLNALVPDYLPEVPLDPFDGKPLRLLATDEGIVIYSFGEDGYDDEGFVVDPDTGRTGSDVGFRLNRLEHRGLLIIEEEPPEEE
jgi:hypothetical protein